MRFEITIEKSDIRKKVCSHLSAIGKRTKDEKGESIWSSITASSPEFPIVEDYIDSGLQKVLGEIRDVTDDSSIDESRFNVTIENSHWDNYPKGDLGIQLSKAIERYAENYAIAEFLGMFGVGNSKKYESEGISILADIKRIAFWKPSLRKAQYAYTRSIRCGSTIMMNVGDKQSILYKIDSNSRDDIECWSENVRIVRPSMEYEGLTLEAVSEGITHIKLYSRHNSDVTKIIKVIVTRR